MLLIASYEKCKTLVASQTKVHKEKQNNANIKYSQLTISGAVLVPKQSSHSEQIPAYQSLSYSESLLW